MTRDVNAAIEGAFAAGATDVVVKDAHGDARNLVIEKLTPRAQVISGWTPETCMVDGIGPESDALVLVGYHARVGTPGGTISHTMSGVLRGVWYNGVAVGESGISAAHAGAYGVPLVCVTGDQALATEVGEVVGPDVAAVVVKEALRRECVRLLSPEVTWPLIRDGVAGALKRAAGVAPFRPAAPIQVRVALRTADQAASCARVPTVEQVDDVTVATTAADGHAAARLVSLFMDLAARA
jgi:D-amino peptidase